MEIILKQDIIGLGHAGDILTVKDGYSRNYLIPKGYAILATESAKKVLAENTKQRAHKEAKLVEEAQAVVAEMEGKEFVIGAKTSKTGKIFGAVNSIQLAQELKNKGFDIDRKKIKILNEPIKEVGDHKAIIKLYRGVETEVEFKVVAE